jgi:hypothetical protein
MIINQCCWQAAQVRDVRQDKVVQYKLLLRTIDCVTRCGGCLTTASSCSSSSSSSKRENVKLVGPVSLGRVGCGTQDALEHALVCDSWQHWQPAVVLLEHVGAFLVARPL